MLGDMPEYVELNTKTRRGLSDYIESSQLRCWFMVVLLQWNRHPDLSNRRAQHSFTTLETTSANTTTRED